MNWLQVVSAVVREHLKSADLGRHPWIRETLWNSRFPEDRFQHSAEEKKKKIGYIREGRKNLPVLPLYQNGTMWG